MLSNCTSGTKPTTASSGMHQSTPADAERAITADLLDGVDSASPSRALGAGSPEGVSPAQRRHQSNSSPLAAWIEGARMLGERSMSLQDSHWHTAMVRRFVVSG
jgi:hypothetical protein